MISLGRRDAREDLGLGFGSEKEMEDTELEEGEACSYQKKKNFNINKLKYVENSVKIPLETELLHFFFYLARHCDLALHLFLSLLCQILSHFT
jgi:hypothetical protein